MRKEEVKSCAAGGHARHGASFIFARTTILYHISVWFGLGLFSSRVGILKRTKIITTNPSFIHVLMPRHTPAYKVIARVASRRKANWTKQLGTPYCRISPSTRVMLAYVQCARVGGATQEAIYPTHVHDPIGEACFEREFKPKTATCQ